MQTLWIILDISWISYDWQYLGEKKREEQKPALLISGFVWIWLARPHVVENCNHPPRTSRASVLPPSPPIFHFKPAALPSRGLFCRIPDDSKKDECNPEQKSERYFPPHDSVLMKAIPYEVRKKTTKYRTLQGSCQGRCTHLASQ